MEVFEIHFNSLHRHPLKERRAESDLIFDSFCYEPENIEEKKLGSLYMVGELRNPLPQNLQLLEKLSQVIKENYYNLSSSLPERAFKESLKKGNEFLDKEIKKENVSWLGNLSFAILAVIPDSKIPTKKWEINFAKTDTLKILLLRGGKIIDIGKNLEFQDFQPYPLKIFLNIATGKLAAEDKIMVLTKEVFSLFNLSENKNQRPLANQSLLDKIANSFPFEEKKLKEILKERKKELSEISGVCLLIRLTEISTKRRKPKILTFQKKLEKFSLAQVFQLFLSPLKNLKFPKPTKKLVITEGFKKNLILVFILIFFFLLGYLIF